MHSNQEGGPSRGCQGAMWGGEAMGRSPSFEVAGGELDAKVRGAPGMEAEEE